jgi:hypothetical protein
MTALAVEATSTPRFQFSMHPPHSGVKEIVNQTFPWRFQSKQAMCGRAISRKRKDLVDPEPLCEVAALFPNYEVDGASTEQKNPSTS